MKGDQSRTRAYPRGTAAHKHARAWYLARYRPGVTMCGIGGEILWQAPGKLDLAHTDDGLQYLGLACRRHNRGPSNGEPGTNPWGGRRRGRAGRKHTRRKLTPAAERDSERRRRLAAKDNKRRARMILPTIKKR